MPYIPSDKDQLILPTQMNHDFSNKGFSRTEQNQVTLAVATATAVQDTSPLTNTKAKAKAKGFAALSGVTLVAALGGTITAAATATSISVGVAAKIAGLGVIGKGLAIAGTTIASGIGTIAAPIFVGIVTAVGVGFLIHHAVKKFK